MLVNVNSFLSRISGSDQMAVALAVTLGMMNYLIMQAVNRLEEVLPTPQALPPPAVVSKHG